MVFNLCIAIILTCDLFSRNRLQLIVASSPELRKHFRIIFCFISFYEICPLKNSKVLDILRKTLASASSYNYLLLYNPAGIYCPKSTMKAPEKCMKYIQSLQ